MNESILTTIKKHLGLPEEYEVFDIDIIDHINSVFSILTQLGVGPAAGFSIADKNATWADFIPTQDPRLSMVISYMEKKVKIMFDPPLSSAVAEATNKIIAELEWRLNVQVDPEDTFNA
jgi:hypothetical protein